MVLDLVIGHTLCKRYPDMREGELTRLRSSLVNETHLASMARELNLGGYLFWGKLHFPNAQFLTFLVLFYKVHTSVIHGC